MKTGVKNSENELTGCERVNVQAIWLHKWPQCLLFTHCPNKSHASIFTSKIFKEHKGHNHPLDYPLWSGSGS